MPSYWKAVNEVIKESDILLEVIDARDIDGTRNPEIEDKARREGKMLIYVLNKCDLVEKDELEKRKKELFPCVFVSSKEYHGIALLKERIMIESHRLKLKFPKVGVVGYPNMGKSSLINAINGSGKASTSSESGHTKGKQYVVARGFKLIDTPGVIPYEEKDIIKAAMTGITTHIADPETVVLKIMVQHRGLIEGFYGVEPSDDHEESLEAIARKLNLLKKGSKPDTLRAGQQIIRDLRTGKIEF